ncbi:MAG: hypothetical protein ACKPKO_16400, partial [Candidatus Fonsibacter sp.]
MIDNGVAPSKLDQPWISAKENTWVCCEDCCRKLGMIEAIFLRTETATFSCTNHRNDALRKRHAIGQHQKSVLE